jgi:hypothetical protein
MSTFTASVADAVRRASSRPSAATPADDPWPEPLAESAFHGLIGEMVRAIEPHTEADPAALLMQMLVMFGNVIGRTAHFRVEADVHHTNLFAGLVGRTSKGRKGVSRGQAQRVLEAVDPVWVRDCFKSGLSSGEGLIATVRDPVEKQHPIRERGRVIDYETIVEDAGVPDKRLLVVESELASTLKVMARDGNTLSPVIRQAWDGHDLRTLTKTSPGKATAPHISLIGHITRDELRRYLEATECANGFGNRFLWVCVRRSKELPDGGGLASVEPYLDPLRAAVEHARTVGALGRTASASERWHAVYGRLSAGRPGLLGAMTGRAEAQVMRLALLYALGDRAPAIDAPHLRAALAVWRYCFASARYLFGGRLGDPIADEILRALRAEYPESLTRRDLLHQVFGRNRTADDINRALALLLECRLAKREEDRSGGGRPAERWFACPESDDLDDDASAEAFGETRPYELNDQTTRRVWAEQRHDLNDQSRRGGQVGNDLNDQSPEAEDLVVKVVRSSPAAESPLVARLRAALIGRAPMKVFELGRAVGAAPELIHRTLRQHPGVFTCGTDVVDHADTWTVQAGSDFPEA